MQVLLPQGCIGNF